MWEQIRVVQWFLLVVRRVRCCGLVMPFNWCDNVLIMRDVSARRMLDAGDKTFLMLYFGVHVLG